MLLKTTKTLCPVCGKVLDAELVDEQGEVWMTRTCPEHGFFRHIYWTDSEMFKRYEGYEELGMGVLNPQKVRTTDGCPNDCGLCNEHHSGTLLANIDLTNRCNLSCDFCFVNAKACGYIYDEAKEGKKFADLPDNWVCPVCGSEKEDFIEI